MSVSPTSDVFTRICRSVEGRYAEAMLPCEPPSARIAPCDGGGPMSLDDIRTQARSGKPDHPERTAAWRHIAGHLQGEAEGEGERGWALIAIWLLVPRLRGGAHSIARRTGAERADVGSALLLGAFEGVRNVTEADLADLEQRLMDAAFAAGWRTGRRGPKEIPLGEWDMAREEAAPPLLTAKPGDVISIGAMSGILAQRAQGERLGALAHRLGLLAHVRQVRRLSRTRPRQPRSRDYPALSDQPPLFETWGTHEASS